MATLEFFVNIFLLFNVSLLDCLWAAFNRLTFAALLAAAKRKRL
jgi:hypothetical protein